MSDSDFSLIILIVFVLAAFFVFPGGPGTPLRMRVDLKQQ